jgi:hypothetical protein
MKFRIRRLPSSLLLKLRIAEHLILAHLGCDYVNFNQLETRAAGQGQKGGQVEWIRLILQLPLLFGGRSRAWAKKASSCSRPIRSRAILVPFKSIPPRLSSPLSRGSGHPVIHPAQQVDRGGGRHHAALQLTAIRAARAIPDAAEPEKGTHRGAKQPGLLPDLSRGRIGAVLPFVEPSAGSRARRCRQGPRQKGFSATVWQRALIDRLRPSGSLLHSGTRPQRVNPTTRRPCS